MKELQVIIPPLSPLAREFLAKKAGAVRALAKNIVRNVFEIGQHLVEVRDRPDCHGEFLPWLDREFVWSERTAYNYIKVYEAFGSNLQHVANFDLPLDSLYKLAAPSTPEAARDTVLERAANGQKLSRKEIKEIIDRAIKTQRTDVEAQLAEVRAQADQREAAIRAEYAGKLMVDPAQLDAKIDAEIKKAVAPLTRQIKGYESKLAELAKREQDRIDLERMKKEKADALSIEVRKARLREQAPDLADFADDDRLSLDEADDALEERERKNKMLIEHGRHAVNDLKSLGSHISCIEAAFRLGEKVLSPEEFEEIHSDFRRLEELMERY